MTAPVGLVVCGAPLASRAADVARALAADGYQLAVGLSEAGSEWIDTDQLASAAEQPAAVRRRAPTEQRRTPRPDRVVAFPLTFNTANKIAAGIMDNHVTGTLCDALGSGAPIVATLMVNDRLWRHPVWASTLARLSDAGVRFLDPHTGHVGAPVPVASGTGDDVVRGFDPAWILNAVKAIRAT